MASIKRILMNCGATVALTFALITLHPSATVDASVIRESESPHSHDFDLSSIFSNEARMFEEFIDKHYKQYKNDLNEKIRRFKIFQSNLRRIRQLNTYELGSGVYGVTEHADLTREEFQTKLGLRPQLKQQQQSSARYVTEPNTIYFNDANFDAPTNFDWRDTSGVVTKVKNQEMCGSCWAFSATGNVEGVWAVKNNESVSLSEQELVDCDKLDNGCGGGLPTNAFKTIIDLGGIESESDYPYDGTQEKCHADRSKSHVHIDSYLEMPKNETFMRNYLFTHGPISIGLNANAMQFYFGGISHPPHWLCDPANLDHGVLLVGYGVGKTRILHRTQPYWVIKNSWGTTWGERGYYRAYRGDDTCGLSQMASSAVLN